MKYQPMAILAALFLTATSYLIGYMADWKMTEGWLLVLELFSVFTSYWCTYLCVFQTRTNYPIGAISVAALCLLFWEQKLYASMVLQIYLFPVLAYGWWRWRPDAITRPVTLAIQDQWYWILGYVGITAVVGYICTQLNVWAGGTNALLDTVVLVLSILAQFLLDNKKLENWLIWIVVDALSVIDYWSQDLKILSIQMGLFGFNAVWAFAMWYRTFDTKPVAQLQPYPNDNW